MPSTQETSKLAQALQRWADGKATLKEVRGYTDEQLYAVARTAYNFFNQGKVKEARTIFQGLFAINPRDAYFARALGVVEYASGNAEGSLAAWDVACRLAPDEAAGYLGRAEVFLAGGQKQKAAEDLKRAAAAPKGSELEKTKSRALLDALRAK
ncbi:MAG: tetratricopeptide repeat protein [Myxococcales bacterium]